MENRVFSTSFLFTMFKRITNEREDFLLASGVWLNPLLQSSGPGWGISQQRGQLLHWPFSRVCFVSSCRENSSISSSVASRQIAEGQPRLLFLNSLLVYRKALAGCAGKSGNRSVRQVPGSPSAEVSQVPGARLAPGAVAEGMWLWKSTQPRDLLQHLVFYLLSQFLSHYHPHQLKCENNGQKM